MAIIRTPDLGGGLSSLRVPSIVRTAPTIIPLSDAESMIRWENGADVAYSVPTNGAVAFPIDTWIQFYRTTGFEVTITALGGVTFEGDLGNVNFKIDLAQGNIAFIVKTGTDRWMYGGSIKAV